MAPFGTGAFLRNIHSCSPNSVQVTLEVIGRAPLSSVMNALALCNRYLEIESLKSCPIGKIGRWNTCNSNQNQCKMHSHQSKHCNTVDQNWFDPIMIPT